MKRRLISLFIMSLFVFLVFVPSARADDFKKLEKENTRYIFYENTRETASSTVEFWVTYYTPELWKLEKEKNKDLVKEGSSEFIKSVLEEETLAFKVRIENNASPIELNPISGMITLRVGKKIYRIVDSDIELSYSFQGENEGFIYFLRYDKKTGEDILKDAKSFWIELNPRISPVMQGRLESLRWNL